MALPRAAGPYSGRKCTSAGAATSAPPNTIITTPAARRPRGDSHQTLAVSSAIAGISGRMYCGRFDCEREKKSRGTRIQRRRKSRGRSLVVGRRTNKKTLHGSAPNSRNGTKYHGGPVRLSAFVARRSAVSVTTT